MPALQLWELHSLTTAVRSTSSKHAIDRPRPPLAAYPPSAEEMLPAVAQGAIGIACRDGDDRSGELTLKGLACLAAH